MSDPDNFLSRWSRRKLEPTKEGEEKAAAGTKPAEAQLGTVQSETSAKAPAQAPSEEAPFDLSSLPPIESIAAGTDIRDFLRPGVPLSLSRAALRRAWTSDPAIRDFIEIAENQWDFTAPDSIPGFGPLDPAEARRLLAQFMGSSKEDTELAAAPTEGQIDAPQSIPPENAVATCEPDSERAVTAPNQEQPVADETAGQPPEQPTSQRNKENDAAQNDPGGDKLSYAPARHGHGGALPT